MMSSRFATLALVQNAGGLYAGCDNFSRDYAPPLPLSGHEVIVGGGWEPSAERCRARVGEMLTTLVVG